MSKLPVFHKARLESHGFTFLSPQQTKAFHSDLNPGEFVIGHPAILEWVDSHQKDSGAPEHLAASYHDGRIHISVHGNDYDAPINSIPMVSMILGDAYGAMG